jgi:DNA-binding response OmpR family regulator
MKGNVLVVEDEQTIAELVRAYLSREGWEVTWVRSGEDALDELGRHPVRLVVLDIGLPGIDGFDRVAGLEAGADDYVSKPFSPRELAARVKAILRRVPATAAPAGGILAAGGVQLDHASRAVTVEGEPVDLTSREFELLATLLAHPNVVLSRDRLLEAAWGGEFPGGTRTVDVHVAQLRRKLDRPRLIETVRGVGYKVVP